LAPIDPGCEIGRIKEEQPVPDKRQAKALKEKKGCGRKQMTPDPGQE
jgi:hypothetical protein